MALERYVVVGLAAVRSPWFREVGRWATAAAIPADFVKCVSTEELRARLGGGRGYSAVLLDAGLPGIDRDLLDTIVESGAAVVMVDDGRTGRDWKALGATATLPADFGRRDLMDVLATHGRVIERADRLGITPGETEAAGPGWMGRLVAVTGGHGAGTSTLAMALAQGLGDDPRFAELTLVADLALSADQAMLHDVRDVLPGIQEMVEAHRAGTPTLAELRSLVFEASDRRYHLLLGLRRHRDWAVLRPRAVAATMDSLLRSYRIVVTDIEPDFEGEDDVGSTDIEDRNLLARSVARRADLVVACGTPTMKGLHDVLRVIGDLLAYGVPPDRILPVINRSTNRPGRGRADITAAFGELITPLSTTLSAPVHIPERRHLEDLVRDNARLPTQITKPLAAAVLAGFDHLGPAPAGRRDHEPVAVTPGSLGHYLDEDET